MARYDAGWGRDSGGGYDAGYRGFGGGYGGGPAGYRGYDRGYGGGAGEEWADVPLGASIYGPERYGLGPYHERLRKRRRPDAELREEVEEALFYDTWVDAERIQVEVKEGIVTLRGELPSYDEIRYATDDAWDVEGVLGVRSELTVARG